MKSWGYGRDDIPSQRTIFFFPYSGAERVIGGKLDYTQKGSHPPLEKQSEIKKEGNPAMRKLKCFQISGLNVQEVLDEFNERSQEFGVSESDILTVSALPPTKGTKLATPTGTADPKVEVVIVYWADK